MADNTWQFRWIVTIHGGIDYLFRNDPAVFVAGNLLWYPVEGQPSIRIGPDVFLAFGRPKGERGSYKQWEEAGIAPQVVFEVLSPGNRPGAMGRKFDFYERYGVEEYYLFDPDENTLDAWLREDAVLRAIPKADGWVSPRMGVSFDMSGPVMRILGPDGQPIRTQLEVYGQRDEEKRRADQADQRANQEAQRADQEAQRADQEAQRADQEAQRANQEAYRAAQAAQRAERLAARLRELGLDPNNDH